MMDSEMLANLKGSTTLCHCWKITLADGSLLGFSDHDRDLIIDGIFYRAASGLNGTEVQHGLGFAVGGSEISGALTHDVITSTDLEAGKYDGASIETWWVDWSNPARRMLLEAGMMGEVRRNEYAFTAEVRSIAQLFERPKGRFFSRACSAQFGSPQCKAKTLRFASRLLQIISDYEIHMVAVNLDLDAMIGGAVNFKSGERVSIRECLNLGDKMYVRLWMKMSEGVKPGDFIEIESACNKTRHVCDVVYRNIENFRGFPLMPSPENILLPADPSSQILDGGSLLR
jgi:uncharacterized phage protein (TIGR02218 family)